MNMSVVVNIDNALRSALNPMVYINDVKLAIKDHTAKTAERSIRLAQKTQLGGVFAKGYSKGYLRTTYRINEENYGMARRIIVGAEYGVYQEYGTRNMEAQPFMRPALEPQGRLFIEEIKQIFSNRAVGKMPKIGG